MSDFHQDTPEQGAARRERYQAAIDQVSQLTVIMRDCDLRFPIAEDQIGEIDLSEWRKSRIVGYIHRGLV